MNVLIVQESPPQRIVAGDVRQNAQLDLGIVGHDQLVVRCGDKGIADGAACLRPDRDILKVRFAGADPPGDRAGLVERGVDAARLRVDQHWQGVEVG